MYRDSSDRTLEDYPRPSVAVDTAVLTVPDSGVLSVLLTRTNDALRGNADEWRLPGTFLHPGETLADAVQRSLRVKAGITGLEPRQLHVFDAPDRDDRGWVLSVAHLAVVPAHRLELVERTRLVDAIEHLDLKYDHDEIVAAAIEALRADYRRAPDPADLMPRGESTSIETDGLFTILDLRRLHEAVLGERLARDAFRRLMLPQLEPTGILRRGARGKPAELYRRRER